MIHFNRRTWLAGCAGALAWPAASLAQDKYPSRPIKFVSPAPPGGLSDTIPRILATELAASMHTPVVVENKPGAGGVIGTGAVATAPADGYTLVIGTGGSMTMNPYFFANQTYDTGKDFTGIALAAFTPLYVVVRSDSPYKSLDDLVKAAKASPGTLAYGTIGPGSTSAVASAMFAKARGLDFIDVPFAGYPPALTELLGGRLAFTMLDSSAVERIEHGSLRALAVTTAKRVKSAPNVPTLKELGVDVDLPVWFGIYVRSGVPADVLQRLRAEVRKAIEGPAFRRQIEGFGLEPGNLFGDEFQKFHLAELKRLGETLPTLGIKGLVKP